MGVLEGVQALVPVHTGTILQQALRYQDTVDDDEIKDAKQQVSGGASGAAIGRTQDIALLELELESYLEGLKQKVILQRMDMQQQAALRGPSSLSSTIGDILRARQSEKQVQQLQVDQDRAPPAVF